METYQNNTNLLTLDIGINDHRDDEFVNNSNILKYKIYSIISWILLIYSSWMDLIDLNPPYSLFIILLYGRGNNDYDSRRIRKVPGMYPIDIEIKTVHMFITILIIIGFINFLMLVILKKDKKLENAMFGRITKYHFIPLLFTSGIFFLMEYIISIDEKVKNDNIDMSKKVIITIFIFTVFALSSLFYIYINTKIKNNHIILLTIKKGVYSSLIVLLLHTFFNCIIIFRYIYILENSNSNRSNDLKNLVTTGDKIISSLFGILVISFSFIFKDIVAMFVSFLMFVGITISKYPAIKNESVNYIVEFIIDAFFMTFSFFALFAFSIQRIDKKILIK